MPGLNWCQLINFWCHLINIWGHVLLTISINVAGVVEVISTTSSLKDAIVVVVHLLSD